MAQLQNLSAPSIGRLGLQTSSPGTESPLDIARVCTNAVIQASGRVSARQAFNAVTPSGGAFGANVRSIHETIRKDGSIEVVAASDSNFHVYNKTTGVVTNLAGTAAVTNGLWQFSNDNNQMIASQDASTLQVFQRDGSGNWITQALTNLATWTDAKYGVSHVAFGRAWVANRSDEKSTVYGSVLLNMADFNSAGAGSIDLSRVWANGQDEIVAITSHANFLILIGKTQVVVYNTAADLSISGMSLAEVIKNVGCVSKFSVASTGTDIMWLSQQGVVSLGRLITQQQLPVGDISKNVHFDLINKLAGYTSTTLAAVRGVYQRDAQNYILTFGDTTAYCFSIRQRLEDGSAIVTTWDSLPTTYGTVFTRDGTFYSSGATGLMLYSGYDATAFPYNLEWTGGYADFGDPSILKFLKRLNLRALGATAQAVNFKWAWDFQTAFSIAATTMTSSSNGLSEWGIAEWGIGEWSIGAQVTNAHVIGSRSGSILQVGISAPINGSELTLYSLDILLTTGKRRGGN